MFVIQFILLVKDGFGEQGKAASGDQGGVHPNAILQITLELVSWKIVSNVTDDKKVVKKILKEGKVYERPNDGAVVKCELRRLCSTWRQMLDVKFLTLLLPLLPVKLIGKLQDGTVFLKKGHDDGDELFEFKTDEGDHDHFQAAPYISQMLGCYMYNRWT